MTASCSCERRRRRWPILLWGVLASSPVLAGDPARDALDAAVLGVLEQPGADAATGLRIEQPARQRHELGAVIDAAPADGGLPRVMAVTPGAAADRIGLLAGDRLLGINQHELVPGQAAGVLRDAVNGASLLIDFEVQRGSESLRLQGQLDRIVLPAYTLQIAPQPAASGCGRVSTVLKPPPSQSLFPALVHEIDGRLAAPSDSEVFRLATGRHVLKLSELIDPDRFSGHENLKRSKLLRRERFKYLEIDIEPDTTYRIGVRFHADRTRPIHAGLYWEPVVWEQKDEACR